MIRQHIFQSFIVSGIIALAIYIKKVYRKFIRHLNWSAERGSQRIVAYVYFSYIKKGKMSIQKATVLIDIKSII